MSEHQSVAIVGMGCRFPGGRSVEGFWQSLMQGRDCVGEVPGDRWEEATFYSAANARGKTRSRWGGFIEDIAGFDAEFFGISPREADLMDPQQRLLLEVLHEALEDAGLPAGSLAGGRVGVFIGGFTLDYMLMQLGGSDYRGVQSHTATGSMMTLLANRLSYAYDFTGPSLTVDTACSSSLVAVHLACQAIERGDCDVAIVGGVNALLTPSYTVAESQAGMLSPTGRSRAFDAAADGYVRGEGAGVVVLRPLVDARRNSQRVYAAIRGTAVNQDGRSDGLTVPSGAAQQALMRTALTRAGVVPADLAFVEAHGTGTPVGDPIEANAIGSVVREGRDPAHPCRVGSVKTNIGHLEAGAGVAGLIKAALSLHHGFLPPHLHLTTPNPAIDLEQLGLDIPTKVTALEDDDVYAGVNSFGFGGTNAHIVLERSMSHVSTPEDTSPGPVPVLLPISAKTPAALQELSSRYARSCERGVGSVERFAAAAARRRDHHLFRRGVVGSGAEGLARALDTPFGLDLTASDHVALAHAPLTFVYSGMGPQWLGMGQQLYADEATFRLAVDEVVDVYDSMTSWSLGSVFTGGLDPVRMEQTEVAQPANFALQVGLTALWRSWGVDPGYVMGHSAGEPAATWAAGIFSLPDAARIVHARSVTQQRTTGQGTLMAVGLPLAQLRERLAARHDLRIDVAGINSPEAITVVGSEHDVADLARDLDAADVFCRRLTVRVPYHSFYMEDIKDDLLDLLDGIRPGAARIPVISTVTGTLLPGERFDAAYWYRNVREPVIFQNAVQEALGKGVRKFLEVGPHPVLTRSVHETAEAADAASQSVRTVSSLRRGEPERQTVLSAAAQLYEWGTDLDWPVVLPAVPAVSELPTYPWQHQRFWHENHDSAQRALPRPHPLIWRAIDGAAHEWEADLDVPQLDYLSDHRLEGAVVFPGAGYTEMALWCAREVYGDLRRIHVQDLRFVQALYPEGGEPRRLRVAVEKSDGRFVITSKAASDPEWTLHCTGVLCLGSVAEPVPALGVLNTPREAQRQVYRELAGLGLDYGPEFQVLQWVQRHEREVIAHVRLSPVQAELAGDYVIHPLLIDAAFQTLALGRLDGVQGKTFMPVGVTRGAIVGEIPAELMIRATLHHGSSPQEIRGDIYCYDLDGRPAFTIQGCRARDVAAGTAMSRPQELYALDWVTKAPAATGRDLDPAGASLADQSAGRWVVLGGDEFGELLAAALERRGTKVSAVDAEQGSRELGRLLTELAPVRGLIDLGATAVGEDAAPGRGIEVGVQVMHDFQACADLTQTQRLRVWVLTHLAQPVLGQIEHPMQSTAWGAARVAGQFEHPSSWGGLVDLEELDAATAELVADHVLAGGHEDQVAFYAGERYVPRMSPRQASPAALAPLRQDAAYLITGGFGALGSEVAAWMVGQGARHLVLLGRGTLPPREVWHDSADPKVACVRRLEALGASVEVHCADVADEDGLRQFVRHREQQGRVPIRGVVHSAGTAVPKLLVTMTDEDFHDVATPKVHGGYALDRVFSTGLDFFVMFSSIASLVVSAGQVNYAAGNAYLDALAFQRRQRGEPAVAVNWGPWGDVGMATQLDLVSFFAQRGLSAMSAQQGIGVLSALMASDLAQAAVIAPEWGAVVDGYPLGAAPAMLDDVRRAADRPEPEVGTRSFTERFEEAAPDDRPALVLDEATAVVAQVLRYPPDELPAHLPLTSLGLDSLMAIEVKGRLEKYLGVNVPIVTLLKGTTLTEVVGACQEQLLDAPNLDEEVLAVLASAADLTTADLLGGTL